MALPKRLTISITIYSRWQNILTGQWKPMRRILHGCTWQTETIPTALATGLLLQHPTVITIFEKTSGLKYIPVHEWLAMPEPILIDYWTVNLTGALRPIIVPYESIHEFNWGTSAEVDTQESRFISGTPGIVNSGNPQAVRAQRMDDNMMAYRINNGTGEKAPHIVIMGS